MFIAFEGPDNVGKSTSATKLAGSGTAIYNARKDTHALMQKDHLAAPEIPITYDRIDWFTHMVYRLALPDSDWNDDRVRTVFAMPDTHLIIKVHAPEFENFIADEAVHTPVATVNQMYRDYAEFLIYLNRSRSYSLFRSIGVMEVSNDESTGTFSQGLIQFDSPGSNWSYSHIEYARTVTNDDDLLDHLYRVDSFIG